VLRILHNPRYAGAYVFGRHHTRKTADGRSKMVPVLQEEWETLIPGAHAGYLSWEDYQQNQKRLHESAQAMGSDRRKSPAREGPALLQGLLLCGRCGGRMTVTSATGVCVPTICVSAKESNTRNLCANTFQEVALTRPLANYWLKL
jgi:hypothetical protein